MLTAAQLAREDEDRTDRDRQRNSKSRFRRRQNSRKTRSSTLLVQAQIARSGIEMASGILDILPEGYGFLRRAGYYIGNDDIYVSQSQIRRFELRRGDMVEGQARRPKESEKYYGLIRVDKVNGLDPEAIKGRPRLRKGNADLSAGAFQARSAFDAALDARHRSLLADRQRPARADRLAAEGRQDDAAQEHRQRDLDQSSRRPYHRVARRRASGRSHRHAAHDRRRSGRVDLRRASRESHDRRRAGDGAREAPRRAGQRRRDPARFDHASGARVQPSQSRARDARSRAVSIPHRSTSPSVSSAPRAKSKRAVR